MKPKTLLLASFCLFVSSVTAEANTPTRDYKMVDLKNGLTTELLEVGKTSFTFSVQWPLDREIEMGYLELIGKLDIEKRGWEPLKSLYLDPAYTPNVSSSVRPVKIDPAQLCVRNHERGVRKRR